MCLNYWFAISATVAFTSLISYGDNTRIVVRFCPQMEEYTFPEFICRDREAYENEATRSKL